MISHQRGREEEGLLRGRQIAKEIRRSHWELERNFSEMVISHKRVSDKLPER